jgi:hypothetical protein
VNTYAVPDGLYATYHTISRTPVLRVTVGVVLSHNGALRLFLWLWIWWISNTIWPLNHNLHVAGRHNISLYMLRVDGERRLLRRRTVEQTLSPFADKTCLWNVGGVVI